MPTTCSQILFALMPKIMFATAECLIANTYSSGQQNNWENDCETRRKRRHRYCTKESCDSTPRGKMLLVQRACTATHLFRNRVLMENKFVVSATIYQFALMRTGQKKCTAMANDKYRSTSTKYSTVCMCMYVESMFGIKCGVGCRGGPVTKTSSWFAPDSTGLKRRAFVRFKRFLCLEIDGFVSKLSLSVRHV
jgi:hypothetical protein